MENSNSHWPVTVVVSVTKRNAHGLGIVVSPKTNHSGVVISELIKDGEAQKTGLLRPGDTILRVNDHDLNGLPYEQCLQILQELPVDKEARILLRVPEGYTARLVTIFAEDGTPRTSRYTTPLQNTMSPVHQRRRESIPEEKIRKLKYTLDQSNIIHGAGDSATNHGVTLTTVSKQNGLAPKKQMSPERPVTLSAK